MLLHRRVLLACFMLMFGFQLEATTAELLTPPDDAPRYQLSNLRAEQDRFGRQVLAVDFRRTRAGKGSASISGKSADGDLSISAFVPAGQDSGTIRLSSLFGRGQVARDIELYFVQSHRISATKTMQSMISNAVRMGNPGPATQARPWTADEKSAHAEFVRIMNDDSAHKPLKQYVVSVAAAEGFVFVPSTAKLVKGTRLYACYKDMWNPLTTISENDDGTVNVHWDKFGVSSDCSMIRGELTIETSLLDSLEKHPAGRFPETVPNWASASAKTTAPASPDAKPRKRYPVSIAVPSDSQFVPQDLTVKAGVKLQACYAGRWNPITVLGENEDGTLEVHWDKYGSSSDCSMVREELIIKKAVANQLRSNPDSFVPVIEPLRRKAYPVAIAVPSDSVVVPKHASIPKGTKLQACYARKWNPITALSEANDGSLNVRWDDYGAAFDCSMLREQLIIKKATLQQLPNSSPAADTPIVRTWTDATGQFRVKAKLISQSDTQVTLLTEAGKEVTLPLSKLSENDREFLQSMTNAVNPFE